MLKNVYTLYCKYLERIVKFCTKDVTYFFERNKSKKNDKHLLKNYRPISLRPIYDKGLKKLIYNTMFDFSVNNHLIFFVSDLFKLHQPADCFINNHLIFFVSDLFKLHQSVDTNYI